MKITEIKYLKDDLMYEGSLEIEIQTNEGNKSVNFGHGEPEDNCLARDLSGAFSISGMLEMAYNAGKAGEQLEKESITEEY